MVMQGSVTVHAESFEQDLKSLEPTYAGIRAAVAGLEEFLRLDYSQPEIQVDPETAPRVYAIKLDYPPAGAAGRSLFLVTYHATDPNPSPNTPYRTFTLLTIGERHPH